MIVITAVMMSLWPLLWLPSGLLSGVMSGKIVLLDLSMGLWSMAVSGLDSM